MRLLVWKTGYVRCNTDTYCALRCPVGRCTPGHSGCRWCARNTLQAEKMTALFCISTSNCVCLICIPLRYFSVRLRRKLTQSRGRDASFRKWNRRLKTVAERRVRPWERNDGNGPSWPEICRLANGIDRETVSILLDATVDYFELTARPVSRESEQGGATLRGN